MDKTPTKKCPECQSDISALAKICPVCRSKQRHTTRLTKIIVITLFGIPFFIGLMNGLTGTEPPSQPTQADPTNYAWIYAEDYIEQLLKAPSTAKFCKATVTKIQENQYRVTSCVDSQNSFGAMIRSEWEVVIDYAGSNPENPQSWYPSKIIFDGKTVD